MFVQTVFDVWVRGWPNIRTGLYKIVFYPSVEVTMPTYGRCVRARIACVHSETCCGPPFAVGL